MVDGWKDVLDLEIRDRLERFPDTTDGIRGIAKSYLELDRAYKTRGKAPENPDAYVIPETQSQIKGILKGLAADAHQAGLTEGQWERLAKKAVELEGSQRAALEGQLKELNTKYESTLREKYGAKFDEKTALAHRWFDKLVPKDDPLRTLMELTPLGSHPAMVEHFAQIGEIMNPDTMPASQDDIPPTRGTSAEQAMELAKKGQTANIKAQNQLLPMHERTSAREEYYKIMRQLVDAGYEGTMDERLNPNPERELTEQLEREAMGKAMRT